ncbi:FKBP-type peptidyl-prolyl cis-trans isomerase [Zafaria sp. J156]|uniref:FKBP-type peptidyl-prolyl cis-trans isomerase n=1 Tax=Zafaria sp. J156 TaxID=3116490 RepID=UPI002E78D41B|nr:FKBP-type peptidyl-prolyl cis-trans isomerase [Zafaria sp. J156]MEE1621208.1 FKBP-type peptidyl-prolyl cis-trans isomerase [Zafaria sp. J156]
MRKLLAVVLAASLVALAGCGSPQEKSVGNADPLSSIEITPGEEENSGPTVTFDTPLTATEAAALVVKEGDGDEIKENQNVSYKLAGYKTEDGSQLGQLFDQEPQVLSLTEEMKAADPEIYGILLGAKVGSWIAYVRPAAPAAGGDDASSAPAEEQPTAEELLILQVVSAEDIPEPSKTYTPDEVKELEEEGALPSVEFDDDDKPTITIPEGKEAPEGLAVQVLKEGDGEELTAESTVTAHYEGVRWEDGEVFDSSYERGEPTDFPLNGVIKGWTEGLTGIKAGSTVVLSIPADKAYGDPAPAGAPAGPLVFVVEVQAAK